MNAWLTVDAARACLRQGTGRGIKIAVLDSGVEVQGGRTLIDDLAVVEDGWGLSVVDGERRDVYGHGTAIADLIWRVAPDVEIGSFRVLGKQLRSRTAIICEGVRQALDRGYHILNCSFGCGREDLVLQYKEWIDEAYLRGRHVVAACNNLDFTKREWPGHFPTVITVNFLVSGDPETFHYLPGQLVEFAARGRNIDVAWKGGARKRVTGSSFAAPHVAGFLARLLSGCPGLPPLEAKALLHRLAEPSPPSPPDPSADR